MLINQLLRAVTDNGSQVTATGDAVRLSILPGLGMVQHLQPDNAPSSLELSCTGCMLLSAAETRFWLAIQ